MAHSRDDRRKAGEGKRMGQLGDFSFTHFLRRVGFYFTCAVKIL